VTGGWNGVNKDAPCPACAGIHRCAWSPDGTTLHCFREQKPPDGMRVIKPEERGALFGFIDKNQRHDFGQTAPPPRVGFAAEFERLRKNLTIERREVLAEQLGLPVRALESLDLGWASFRDLAALHVWSAGTRPLYAWVFAERNARREIVGLQFRAPDGGKRNIGKRGLVIPVSFGAFSGPVVPIEGATDVGALAAVGVCAIGRPSNVGGVDQLAELLAKDARDVLVVGENDSKGDGRWPGLEGAESTASKLSATRRRPVRWSLPPNDVKDVREWLVKRAAAGLDLTDVAACELAGRELLAELQRNSRTIEPHATGSVEVAQPVGGFVPFPTDALPEPVRSWVRDMARALNVNEAGLAVLKLATTAALIGNARRLQLTGSWDASSIIWAVVIAPSGEMKSAMLRCAGSTLSAIDRDLREQSAGEVAAAGSVQHGARPAGRALVLRDCTIEAAIKLSMGNPRGLVYMSAELAGLFKSLNMYRQGGKGNDRERLLATYDGDENSRDLVLGSQYVARCALSVLGVSTPAAFRQSLGKAGEEDGALARFLVTMPPTTEPVSFEALREAARPDTKVIETLERELASLQLGQDDEPVVLVLTDSGVRAFSAFRAEVLRMKKEAVGALRAHYLKLEEVCARIAIGFYCIRAQSGDLGLEAGEGVDGTTIEAAARVTLWLAREAARVYSILLGASAATADPTVRLRQRLLDVFERHGDLSKRDAKNCAAEFAEVDDADFEHLLRGLVSDGELESETVATGGRSKEVFRRMHKRKATNSERIEASACACDPESAPGHSAATDPAMVPISETASGSTATDSTTADVTPVPPSTPVLDDPAIAPPSAGTSAAIPGMPHELFDEREVWD